MLTAVFARAVASSTTVEGDKVIQNVAQAQKHCHKTGTDYHLINSGMTAEMRVT
jgi:hypothetical protein